MTSKPDNSGLRGTNRIISVGGLTPAGLLMELERFGVRLNDAARTLLENHDFQWSRERQIFSTVELSIRQLGLPGGARIADVHGAATAIGLRPPPIELAPHMRIQYIDQPEGFVGFPITSHCAPPGSITVASVPLSANDDFPKGFYLRRIDGVPWLRGYMSSPDHLWDADDRFVFVE